MHPHSSGSGQNSGWSCRLGSILKDKEIDCSNISGHFEILKFENSFKKSY